MISCSTTPSLVAHNPKYGTSNRPYELLKNGANGKSGSRTSCSPVIWNNVKDLKLLGRYCATITVLMSCSAMRTFEGVYPFASSTTHENSILSNFAYTTALSACSCTTTK